MRQKHNHEYVFTNLVTGKHISNGAMLHLLKSRFQDLKLTTHGFRASFRTWAEEQNTYKHYAIKFSQAHELPNKVEKEYMRSDVMQERTIHINDGDKYILSK